MNLLKNVAKFCLKGIVVLSANHALHKSQEFSYRKTGFELSKAKRNGYRINGKKQYYKNLRQRTKQIESRKDVLNSFIDNF